MSNIRETILAYIEDLLQDIVVLPYNTHPTIIRGMEHWNDTVNFPSIIIDEGEPESSEDIAFGWKQSTIDLMIMGRMQGTWEEANQLNEDIRRIMESSTANATYWGQCTLVSTRVAQDPNGTIKDVEMHYMVKYEYEWGAA